MTSRRCPQIALLVDTATDWGRRMIRGIGRYAQQQGGWDIWLEQRCQHAPGRLPPGWRGDGIVARVADRAMGRYLAEAPGVVVNVSAARIPGVEFPTVTADLRAAARLAAGHLLDQGFRHFGYFAPVGLSYVDIHYRSFVEHLAEAGLTCDLFRARRGKGARATWRRQQDDLRQWLQGLPKPVAVLTWTSDRGREVLYACRALGLLVPEQVAVMGGDEDSLLCETCNPPLSGVALTSERIGYDAAALLDRLLHGAPCPAEPILIEPTRVVVRQSTDTLAITDPDLARAIAFIRTQAATPIQVSDVLRDVAVSRSWLERRFQEALGRSPAEEIRRVRLERAKQLLADTELPVPQVAAASGFGSREYLAYAFRHATSLTPREFRQRVRGR
ncbi:MAG: substrate-binding domain-containing protein [Candidatus Anammoximicrobium sp.]|nr:substrate-binding domain-containing protein [Candidatus Anammoximicrobium sp.]